MICRTFAANRRACVRRCNLRALDMVRIIEGL